jgi:SulP family sulfate permease
MRITLRIVGAHGSARDLLRADGVEEKVGGLDRTVTLDSLRRADVVRDGLLSCRK